MTEPTQREDTGKRSDATDPFSRIRDLVPIPQLGSVPETKEERRKRTITRIVTASIVAVLVIIGVIVGLQLHSASELAEAVELAGDDGRLSSLTAALDAMEGDDDSDSIALRARLLACQAFEHAAVDPELATEELGRLDPDEPTTMNALAATTYLALSANNVAAAEQEASRIVVGGTWAAEAARARALASVALGNPEGATAEAQLAVDARPGAPRHAALLALIKGWLGEGQAGVEILDAVPGADASPAVRAARARVLVVTHGDAERARADAQALIDGDLSDESSDAEKAWAHLVLAVLAARAGDSATAVTALEAATATRPPGDVTHTLTVAETWLMLGAVTTATEELGRLPEDARQLGTRRAQAAAELSLLRGDARAAQNALRSLGDDARTELLRGLAAEARGQTDEARTLFVAAAEDASAYVTASTRIAAIDLAADRARDAKTRLDEVLERVPGHPDVVTVAAQVRVKLDDAEGAMQLVADAVERYADEPKLLAARGRVHLALEQWEPALESLSAAAEERAEDADLHTDLGVAAHRAGQLEQARDAFDRALELSAEHRRALIESLELAIAMGDGERSGQRVSKLVELNVASPRVDHARARHYVLVGSGSRGVVRVRRLLARNARDPVLFTALGDLFRQAADYRSSITAYGTALGRDENAAEARLGRAISQIRLGAGDAALEGIEQAATDGAALGPAFAARVEAAKGRIQFMAERYNPARQAARRALELDPASSDGHLLLADIAAARDQGSLEHLRRVVSGREAHPEAMARIAISQEINDEVCEMTNRYLRAAPQGRFADRVRNNRRSCRQR